MMIQEVIKALEAGKSVSISARVTAYNIDDKGTKHSITLIFNKESVTKKERSNHVAFGVSFSIKRFLESLKALEKEKKITIRKSESGRASIYLIDGDEGKIQATIIIREVEEEK